MEDDYQTIKKVFRGKRKSNQSGLRRKPKREVKYSSSSLLVFSFFSFFLSDGLS